MTEDERPVRPDPAQAQGVLAEVWRDVLGVPALGLDDDFFAMGGNSMLAVRAIVGAEERGVVTTLVDMLAGPTIREISERVSGGSGAEPPVSPSPVAEDRRTSTDVAPAALLQQGLIFESQSHDDAVYLDVVSHTINLRFDEAVLRSALDLMTERHETLRTSFNLTQYDEIMRQRAAGAVIPLEVTDGGGTGGLPPVEADVAQVSRPFDVARSPLMRARVSIVDDDTFRLTYGLHHAIMDGWSETVFADELISTYTARLHGREPDLPASVEGMDEFVRLERAALESAEARAFWSARITDLPRARSMARLSTKRRLDLRVEPALASELYHVAVQHRLPVKSVLLAAHLAAWGGYHGGHAPVTGLVVNGRPEVSGADRMTGLFLNVLPLQVGLSGSARDLVQDVFDAERDLLPYRRFPYAELVTMAGHPLFETTFNYVHFDRSAGRELLDDVVGETRIFDSTSLPLLVDAVREGAGDDLRFELSADAEVWGEAELAELADRELSSLRALASGLELELGPQTREDKRYEE